MPSKILITGATGFIGGYLVKSLLARHDNLVCLVRNRNVRALGQAGVKTVTGDITNRESLRQAMTGVDAVFHLAALYQIGVRDKARMHQINVVGTRNVCEIARELGVPRLIYCSTVAALGNTGNTIADENFPHDGKFQSEYCRTKYLAHQEAKALIEKGAPIIIVMPSVVYGPGDPSALAESWQRYLKGKMPFCVAPETRYTYVHVEDVVAGMISAYERGRVGESYILAGQVISNREMLNILARLTGRPMPQRTLPFALLKVAAIFDELFSAWQRKTPLVSREAIRMMENCHWAASAAKAQQELDWQPRPLDVGLRETFAAFLPQNVYASV
ncbi:MAG: NAD-dependent epimerase/dehydratase family protein [Acidobacteriota bacterium]